MVDADGNATCPGETVLAEYAAGQLPEATAQAAADHLHTCVTCQAALKDIQQGEELAGRLRAALGLQEDAALRQALAARVTGEYEILDALGRGA